MQVEGRTQGLRMSERSEVSLGITPGTRAGPQAQGLLDGTVQQGSSLHRPAGLQPTQRAQTGLTTGQLIFPTVQRLGLQRGGG